MGEVKGISQSTSYEDLKQSKLQKAGGSPASNSGTSTPSFGIRKARSDPDVNKHNLQKEIEVHIITLQISDPLVIISNVYRNACCILTVYES